MKNKLPIDKLKIKHPNRISSSGLLFGMFFLLSLTAFSQVTTVSSLTELLPYLKQSNVEVKLKPGVYTVTPEDIQNGLFPDYTEFLGRKNYVLFLVSGNNSTYDFTDVTINVETAVFNAYSGAYDNFYEIQTTGNNNVLKNLTLIDLGSVNDYPKNGACNITMDGSYNRIEGFHITAKGSYPYGYGDSFGKGGSYTIKHYKHSAFLIRGESNHAKSNTIIHRTYGHCMFMQAANNPIIEDCYLEGEMRSTDDMLAETSGPAFDIDFMTDWGYKLPPGYMKSTGEAGIRAYNAGETIIDGVEYSRGTSNVTVLNCTIKHLRTGVTIAHATGKKYVEGTTAIGCENGFSLGSGDVVDSYADCAFGPVYATTYTTDKNFNAEITIIPAEDPYYNGSGNVAYIGGSNHNITLKSAPGLVIDQDLKIKFGGERNHISTQGESLSNQDDFYAKNIQINNLTNFAVLLNDQSTNVTGVSGGMVTDLGTDNNVVFDAVSVNTIEAEAYKTMNGVTTETTTDEGGGENVTAIDADDWLEYEIEVPYAGTYYFDYRIASASNAGQFTLSADGEVKETVFFPVTGGTQSWQTVRSETPIQLMAGTQTLKITAQTAGWNFNKMSLLLNCAEVAIVPNIETFNALGSSLNRVQANNSNVFLGNTVQLDPEPLVGGSWSWTGPNGFSSSERSVVLEAVQLNQSGDYHVVFTNDCGAQTEETFTLSIQESVLFEAEDFKASSGVSTEITTDENGGSQISNIASGDWMEYVVEVPFPATYTFNYRLASVSSGDFDVSLNGEALHQITFDATGGANVWSTLSASENVYLPVGTHTIRITSNSDGWHLNWFSLTGNDFVNPCELPFTNEGFSVMNSTETWSSGVLDISCATSVNAYMVLEEVGTVSASDYVNVYYKLDGGDRVAISEHTGSLSNSSAVVNNLSGSTLELIVEAQTSSLDNYYAVSKISVVETTDPFVRIEAEDYDDLNGPKAGTTGDVDGNQNLGSIKPEHWSMYANLDLTNVKSINARVASVYDDAFIEVRLDAFDGPLAGVIDVPNTGNWQVYETVSAYIEDVTGVYDVYLVYKTKFSNNVCNINWFQFSDAFVKAPTDPFSRVEAEYFDSESGTTIVGTSDIDGENHISDIQDGDWIMFNGLDVSEASQIDFRVASVTDSSIIEVRLDAVDGEIISLINVPNTGASSTWQTISAHVEEVTDEHDIYIVFKGTGTDLLALNWLQFKVYENPFARIEAENFDAQFGDPNVAGSTSDIDGGGDLRGIVPGDWVMFNAVDLTGAESVSARFGSIYDDAFIEVRTGAVDGELIGTIELFNTGGWHNWETSTGNISKTDGVHDLYFVFNTEVSKNVCNINWFQFSEQALSKDLDANLRIEAEDYHVSNGTTIETTTDEDGEQELAMIQDGNWVMYRQLDLNKLGGLDVRVASIVEDATIEVRLGAYDGTLISTVNVPNTGGIDQWETVSAKVAEVTEIQNVYLVFKNTGTDGLRLNWIHFTENESLLGFFEAEDYDDMFGVQIETTSDDNGKENVGYIENNDWIAFSDVDLTEFTTLDVRYSSPNSGGFVEVRLDAVDGRLIGNVLLENTSNWNNWATTNSQLVSVEGVHTVYLVFKGGSSYLYNLNWIHFKSSENPFDRMEIEDFDEMSSGPKVTSPTSDVDGGADIRSVKPGNWALYKGVDLTEAKSMIVRAGTQMEDAFIELRLGAVDGDLIGSVPLINSGGWHNWVDSSANLEAVTGVHDVYLVFETVASANVGNINWFQFSNQTVQMPITPFERIEAENYSLVSGTTTVETTDVDGVQDVSGIQNNTWTMYSALDVSNALSFEARVASVNSGGSIEVRLDGYDGELVSTLDVPNTNGTDAWVTVNSEVSTIEGVHDIYLVFKGEGDNLFDLNWFKFNQESLSIDDAFKTTFRTYPNPVLDALTIKNGAGAQLKLYNGLGRLIFSKTINSNEQTIDMSHLSSGIYILRSQKDGAVVSKKLLKK
ncbi:carbohydrate-binding protein [Formosa sp. 3Alg 14/1]|uniref:carbohydrate-binding protein n=1 Tax=Formosa sp. 3Alg 14/1 TaxID=3382190 RepID=UPI0039BECA36